jgi:hypothetical protein
LTKYVGVPMQRYFSVGISTLVALMAAHRKAANSSESAPAVYDQTCVTELILNLAGNAPAGDAEQTPAAAVTEHADKCG